MEADILVEKIVQEVLKKLQPGGGKKILALFCGGTIGSKEGRAELKKLMGEGYDCQVALSPAAERVLGLDWVRSELGDVPVFTEAAGKNPGAILKETDILLVPVLTFNSAAKVAGGICDTLVTNLIMQGLFLGKPVIAARNACDLQNPVRVKLGMTRANQRYQDLFSAHLKCLEEYGINLAAAEDLGAAVKGEKKENRCPSGEIKKEAYFHGRVLSATDVALWTGQVLCVEKNTLITPAARDLASDRGIQIKADGSISR
ncbi:flavoprotein [Candidatus Formimonas warabiya]|uniref:Flavoprotein domain-containing protein n=1 Tax=Formimonas warabiya TaxID=1761012 RepID=A0A3G1KZY9_FORW1|nr:flavoprotein [Candidatus Formimonas warabiya]ATW27980.1 hypothetical protein DCMF_27385 [Candidatus Formimonas warabiya]